jgi:hypothetical protein
VVTGAIGRGSDESWRSWRPATATTRCWSLAVRIAFEPSKISMPDWEFRTRTVASDLAADARVQRVLDTVIKRCT